MVEAYDFFEVEPIEQDVEALSVLFRFLALDAENLILSDPVDYL